MKFSNAFEEADFRERCAFRDFDKMYNLFNDYNIHMTEIETKSVYDISLQKIIDGSIKKRIFIEIKVRNKVFDDYILETKKYNSLKRLVKHTLMLDEDEYELWYLNFTPEGTLLWDIKNVDETLIKSQKMNKATVVSKTHKVNKNSYYLKPEMAKKWNYTWDEKQLKKYYKEYYLGKVEDYIEKKKIGLDEILGLK